MRFFEHLLAADPASPRLTTYEESTGARMDFSAQTLDNWASKIANMLEEELELESGARIGLDLPVSWQAVVIACGALAIDIDIDFSPGADVDAVFSTLERYPEWKDSSVDVVLVSSDPFGRGIEESGEELPRGTLDFGPIVRFYGDHYFGQSLALRELIDASTPQRLLSTGWQDKESFFETVLSPLAAGGSAVIVAGITSDERLEEIALREKTTARR